MAIKDRNEFISSLRVRQESDTQRFVRTSKGVIYPQYKVKNGIDGIAHIEHTTQIGIKIGENECTEDSELQSIILGCLLHDIGRGREILGQTHGDAGEKVAKQILKEYFIKHNIDIDKIAYAIRNHDKGKTITDRVIGSIWDADRLSLYRFAGKEVRTDLLSTDSAQYLLDYAKRYIKEHMDDYKIDFEKGKQPIER